MTRIDPKMTYQEHIEAAPHRWDNLPVAYQPYVKQILKEMLAWSIDRGQPLIPQSAYLCNVLEMSKERLEAAQKKH